MPPSLMLLLSYGMSNEQIYETINTSRRSVLLCIIGDYILESELEWRIELAISNSTVIGSRNLDRPIFKLKL